MTVDWKKLRHTLTQYVPDDSVGDAPATRESVERVIVALKQADELIDEWTHPLNPPDGINPAPEIELLSEALASLPQA